jgi:hypothetical protein
MTGFKSGASDDDPLGNDSSESDTEAADSVDKEPATSLGEEPENDDNPELSGGTPSELPWIYERTSITDGRKKTVQLHLQQSTLNEQRQSQSDVETMLGESVKKADLREAALLAGLQHLDEVIGTLREWGYER